uniref:F-box domain-containing protein n=2 Tax=Aegilops tauschii subsp. strangulata TaxID=200361 RepID=A0A453MIE1_AEGTS
DELLEEIFLRLPPDEPAHLLRASLASKLWLGLLSSPRFRGRYHEHHGAPPMLGFLHTWHYGSHPTKVEDPIPYFKSTAKFGARIPDDEWGNIYYTAWDCRHGRVLLDCFDAYQLRTALVVWDPMTGCRRELPRPWIWDRRRAAAVLCAVSGCDHRTCHSAPIQLVFVGLDEDDHDDCVARACVSLPETGDWSKPVPQFDAWVKPCPDLHLPADASIKPMPPLLVEGALHFMLKYVDDDGAEILKYDLTSNSLSLIDAPVQYSHTISAPILMAMEDGSLGFAHVDKLTLYIWSRLMDSNRVASWSQCRITNLSSLLPIQNPEEIYLILVGSVEGSDTVFVTTDLGIYEINVKSQRWKKIWKREIFRALIPYMSFYNPQERVTPTPCDAAH